MLPPEGQEQDDEGDGLRQIKITVVNGLGEQCAANNGSNDRCNEGLETINVTQL